MNRHRLLVIPVVAALAFGALAAGQAQAAQRTERFPSARYLVDDDQMVDEPGNGLAACNGGAQQQALVRMNDQPTNLAEDPNNAFANLPGATIVVNVPMNQSRQLLITFSAEARLLGQFNLVGSPVDFMQVQILDNGVPIPAANDLAFTTDSGHANAIEVCKRVGQGAHVLTVQWLLVDQGAANVLTGDLDDWLFHTEVNL
jgi:hypothetical protein